MNFVSFAFQATRFLAVTSLLVCFSAISQAESEHATDGAFAALLAMPGVQPRDGGWVIPEQAEPAPQSESALIARLRQLKKEGANFNAIRHRGTLLAHAIRAGKDRAALWLLPNGADPKLVLFSDKRTAYDLALQYKRTAVVKALEDQYGFKPRAPAVPLKSAAPGTNASAGPNSGVTQSRVEQASQLIAKLMTTPYPNEAAQLEWQKFAATLSPQEYVELFKDGTHLEALIRLVRNFEGGLEDALARLPRDLVHRKAQDIADLLADYSYVTYHHKPKISYNATSRSWPALWSRIDKPLRYDVKPDLAAHIPPGQWPALFGSGYSRHDAEVTGCLLSALDAPAFKAVWSDFQLFFTDAREASPALVLSKYRLGRERSPCYYSSSTDDTRAKLEFLRKQGVPSPVAGLRRSLLDEADDPSLMSIVAAYSPPIQQEAPRLVQVLPTCDLKFNDL